MRCNNLKMYRLSDNNRARPARDTRKAGQKRKMKYVTTIMVSVLSVILVASDRNVQLQVSERGVQYPKISGSTILADLESVKDRDPAITPQALAKRGNEMIAQKGITYVFDVCDFLAQNGKRLREVETDFFQPYSVRLTTVDGQTRDFEIAASDGIPQAPGCYTKIAALRVTDKEMTVIADGKPVTLQRPKGFRLAKTELVDSTLKRVIRSWEVPFQLPPIGISPDGLKLHMDVGVDHETRRSSLGDLGLELSANGEVRFRVDLDKSNLKGQPGRDPYVRFRHNRRTFILRPQFDRGFMLLLATGMLIPPEPILPMETRAFPQRNPTSYEFPGSVSEIKQKMLATFKDFDVMQSFYRSFADGSFYFAVEGGENALFTKNYAKDMFANERNKDDLYLHSHGALIGGSPLYLGGGMPLPYSAEFQLHFDAIDPNKTRVSVITHNPRVYNGTVCCGLHGYKSNTVPVEPSTIEEYKILLFIGRRLGMNDMPMLKLPEGSK